MNGIAFTEGLGKCGDKMIELIIAVYVCRILLHRVLHLQDGRIFASLGIEHAIAGVVAVVGAISVYIAMNNEEQDVKKKIMMVVGACIFLVAAAQALPLFFGL